MLDIQKKCSIILQENKEEHNRSHPQGLLKGSISKITYIGVFQFIADGSCRPFVLFLEVLIISAKDIPINEQITFKEVRVIDADGSQLGILPIKEAIEAAYAKDLDLVNVSPNANPPVCKIMDYGKYRFDIAKREKEARKNQKTIETKEIRLGLSIDKHDFETKGNHAIQFLKSGNKLKVSIRFRGRELGHPEIGLDIMKRFAEYCQEYSVVEKPAKLEGRNMIMILAPKPAK